MGRNTEEGQSSENARIAYVARGAFDDGVAYRGGILVINERGVPMEFRCTSPIRPNVVQRTLYGPSLDPFMLVELIGKPLLSTLRERFDVLTVNEPSFLNIRQQCVQPTVYLRRQGVDLTAETADDDGESALIEPRSQKFAPVVAEVFREDAAGIQTALPFLQRCSVSFDIMEPFERILKALQKVHEEKTLDQ